MIDPSASDWSDLDLLTFSEVRERLSCEISTLESELADLDHAAPDASQTDARHAQALRTRLDALRAHLAQQNS